MRYATPTFVLLLVGFVVLARLGSSPTAGGGRCPDPGTCPDLLYVWGPEMLLSRAGTAEVEASSRFLGLELRVVESSELTPLPSGLGVTLRKFGGFLHYAAVVVLDADQRIGPAILGYKKTSGSWSLIESLRTEPRGLPSESGGPPAGDLRFVWRQEVSPPPGASYRWIPGTRSIFYDSGGSVWILDIESGESRRGPGRLDLVPAPDGRFAVTPEKGGLSFYSRGAVLAGSDSAPFFQDPEMLDQYPSVGVLSPLGRPESGNLLQYRIMVSWFAGVAIRDYEIGFYAPEVRTVRPISPKRHPYANRDYSLPLLPKSGLEFSARNDRSGTTRVASLGRSGRSCKVVDDLEFATGKASFSGDGSFLAFGTTRENQEGWEIDVYERGTGRSWSVPDANSSQIVIPRVPWGQPAAGGRGRARAHGV